MAKIGGWSVSIPQYACTWSRETAEIHGENPEFAPTFEQSLQFYTPEFRSRIQNAIETCATDGSSFEIEAQIITTDGLPLWVRCIAEAKHDENGKIVEVQGALQDITEQKQAEIRLEQMANRLVTTLESITEAFFTLNHDWCFTYVNRAAEKILNVSRTQLLGKNIWKVYEPAVGTQFEIQYRRAIKENRTVIFEEYYPPMEKWFELKAFPSSEGLAVYFSDITDKRKNMHQLKEQAALLDKAQDAILVRDLNHRILYWNRSAERVYGWSASEAVGRSIKELLYKDPTTFLEATSTTIAKGEWVGELTQFNKSGDSIIIEGHWTLLRDDDGQPVSILAINTDITQRKKLEQQFFRAQRMESIGTLAGGIAHDLNNVLAPIMMSIDLLKLKVKDAYCQDLLKTIGLSARRGAEMISQVLSFARGMDGCRIEVQLRHLLYDIEKIISDTFPKNIELHTEINHDLWTLQADPTQLHQVLLNLCVNSRDAMPNGGKLKIAAANAELDEHYAAMNIEARSGPHVRIEVEDTGTGIPRDFLDKIFDPFFTTKEIGKGTGLGLSTTMAIIKSHGGFIRVYSEPGNGTCFRIYLPANSGTTSTSTKENESEMPRGEGQTILVVDDEASVRQITKQTLEAFGYRVLLASDGAEAISIYAQNIADIDVVLTDMMMPIMDGPATIQVILRLNPAARIIAASGITANGNVAKAANAGIELFLPKPYTAETLLRMIAKALK